MKMKRKRTRTRTREMERDKQRQRQRQRFRNTYAAQLAAILHNIFQLSVDSGQVPEAWENGNVTAIFKKGSRAEAANCRPISLTSGHLNFSNISYTVML